MLRCPFMAYIYFNVVTLARVTLLFLRGKLRFVFDGIEGIVSAYKHAAGRTTKVRTPQGQYRTCSRFAHAGGV